MKTYKEYELDLQVFTCENCGAEYFHSNKIFPATGTKGEQCVECIQEVFVCDPFIEGVFNAEICR